MGDDSNWQDSHPSPEQLIAYHEGRLSCEETEPLQDHLASCRECCNLVLDLDFFCSEASTDLPDSVITADWEALREGIGGESFPSARSAPFRPRSWPRQLRVAWTLAAALALVSLGLGLRVGSLEKFARPTAQIAILDLPAFVTRDVEPSGQKIPAQAKRVVLLFHLEDAQRFSRYGLRLLDSNGAELFKLSDLGPDRDSSLTVEMPRSWFPQGSSRFVLSGPHGELIKEYWVESE
jgi:hypothetical protein